MLREGEGNVARQLLYSQRDFSLNAASWGHAAIRANNLPPLAPRILQIAGHKLSVPQLYASLLTRSSIVYGILQALS